MPFFCLNCLGRGEEGKKCYICGKRRRLLSNEKNQNEIIRQRDRERHAFLKQMHKRLTDLNVKTTGDPTIDEEIRRAIGPL